MITNRYHLPKAIVDAIKQTRDDYDNEGSFLSASSALKPVRIFWLERRHSHEVNIDVVDLIWSFLGSATHSIAESAGRKNDKTIAEERFFTEILGEKISGQIDNYDTETKTLSDFKITSVWSVIGEIKEEWIWQLNIQKYLMQLVGYEVNKLQIIAVLRDWQKGKTFDKSYPKHQVKLIKIPILHNEEVEQFLTDRVSLLKSYQNVPDDQLPICTEKERWRKDTVYAVIKKGGKRAIKLFDNEIDASIYANKNSAEVEVRCGEDTRCLGYCSVNQFCNYYKEKYDV